MTNSGMTREQYLYYKAHSNELGGSIPYSSIDMGAYRWWEQNYKPTMTEIAGAALQASPLGQFSQSVSNLVKPLIATQPPVIIGGIPESQLSPVLKAAMQKQGALQAGQPLTPQTSLSDKLREMFPSLSMTDLGKYAGVSLVAGGAGYLLGKGKRAGKKKRRSSSKGKSKKTHPKRSKAFHRSKNKPKPGTKAWMDYIRSKRGKKHGRRSHRSRK